MVKGNARKAEAMEKQRERSGKPADTLQLETLNAFRGQPLVRCMADWFAAISEAYGCTLHYGCRCDRQTLLQHQPHLRQLVDTLEEPGFYPLWPRGVNLTVHWDVYVLPSVVME